MEYHKKIIAGIDDATKCPCIGSIFIAGVVADGATIEYWKKIGVKDSKLVASKKRFKLAKIIKETALNFTIQQITPAMIDDKSFFNLNDWEMLVVFKILKTMYTQPPEAIYIDNWETSEKLFFERLQKLCLDIHKETLRQYKITINRSKIKKLPLIPEHRADENHVIVGAASILAKTASDLQYKQYKKKYGDFGSGSPADPKTRLFVWHHRHAPPPIIRQSWNTYKTLSVLESIDDDPLKEILCKKASPKKVLQQ